MRFAEPSEKGITIYSKSNCKNCDFIKTLLYKYETSTIICDKYLEDDKEEFKSFMFHHMGFIPADKRLYFPVVFYDGRYLKNPSKQIFDYINY